MSTARGPSAVKREGSPSLFRFQRARTTPPADVVKGLVKVIFGEGDSVTVQGHYNPQVVPSQETPLTVYVSAAIWEDLQVRLPSLKGWTNVHKFSNEVYNIANKAADNSYPAAEMIDAVIKSAAGAETKLPFSRGEKLHLINILAAWRIACGPKALSDYYEDMELYGRFVVEVPENENVLQGMYQHFGHNPVPYVGKDAASVALTPDQASVKLLIFCLCATKPELDDYSSYNEARFKALVSMSKGVFTQADLKLLLAGESQKKYKEAENIYPGLVTAIILSFHDVNVAARGSVILAYGQQMTLFTGMAVFRHILKFLSTYDVDNTVTALHLRSDVLDDVLLFNKALTELGVKTKELGLIQLRFGSEWTQTSNWPNLSKAAICYCSLDDPNLKNHQVMKEMKGRAPHFVKLALTQAKIPVGTATDDNTLWSAAVKAYNLPSGINLSDITFETADASIIEQTLARLRA